MVLDAMWLTAESLPTIYRLFPGARVLFIHFNHTNPLLWDAEARKRVESAGFRIGRDGEQLGL